jgi:transcriptional regulator NrdR family protein
MQLACPFCGNRLWRVQSERDWLNRKGWRVECKHCATAGFVTVNSTSLKVWRKRYA